MEKKADHAPFVWMEMSDEQPRLPLTTKRKLTSRKLEFHGWGSKPLIEFLNSIGKDTGEKLSQYEVTDIITEYVKEKDLIHPEKKKRILCDEWLQYLFGRKSVSRNKTHDLLEAHFAENHVESGDEFEYYPEDEEETAIRRRGRPRLSNYDENDLQNRDSLHTSKSCFAAITSENIKHVYLKRSLVLDLVKELQTFETKIVGSFVRIKSDPSDYFQKNSHQLLLVTGVKKVSDVGNCGMEIFLQVSNLSSDVRPCMLSDDNFTEEECEDLQQKVKEGLLERPTVVELEEKARILHEDITKHWIVRELSLLQNLIDQANEKGWRKELFEYLEKKQNLQSPSEQSRLLREAPKVVSNSREMTEESGGLQRPVELEASEISVFDFAVKGIPSTQVPGQTNATGGALDGLVEKRAGEDSEKNDGIERETNGGVIELSSEDDGENKEEDVEKVEWHYVDPQGETQGPFSLRSLKRWSDAGYFPDEFKVWKVGETRADAVLIARLLRQRFPNS